MPQRSKFFLGTVGAWLGMTPVPNPDPRSSPSAPPAPTLVPIPFLALALFCANARGRKRPLSQAMLKGAVPHRDVCQEGARMVHTGQTYPLGHRAPQGWAENVFLSKGEQMAEEQECKMMID